jgi:hypothetical protein
MKSIDHFPLNTPDSVKPKSDSVPPTRTDVNPMQGLRMIVVVKNSGFSGFSILPVGHYLRYTFSDTITNDENRLKRD